MIIYYGLQRKSMMDFKDYINQIIDQAESSKKADLGNILLFLESNNWFGNKPTYKNNKVLITNTQAAIYKEPLLFFLNNPDDSDVLLQLIHIKFPSTTEYLKRFFKEKRLSEQDAFYITDFLLFNLNKDIFLYNEAEISNLVNTASLELNKAHGDYLTFFLSWLRLMTKTAYQKDYIMEKRYTMDIQNEAYVFDEYLKLMFYLFNEDYITDNEMYFKASQSKNYTDAWLYMSLHFICSLRMTDFERIYHPYLPYSPEEVLKNIANDTFSDYDARMVLLSIIKRMCLLPFEPSKTEDKNGIPAVKFNVPSSCEVHFGKLFALAEAHFQLSGLDKSNSLIRKITKYEDINRYMGEEIGSLFLESDFRSRSATKSYLQSIYMITDVAMDDNVDGPRIKGYLIAALARSHKGTYGEFATTTFEYLKDAKFSGLTPEFVAFELLERGPLSFIVSMLLNIITEHDYSKLSVKEQTTIIKKLDLFPHEIENTISIINQAQKQALSVLNETITDNVDILTALHRIGSGQAFSKQPECLCLLTALNKVCPYDENRQCISCLYEISTKSTFYLLISEYNRIHNLYISTDNLLEKNKYKAIATTVILPRLDETLQELKSNYGDEVYRQFERMIQENITI